MNQYSIIAAMCRNRGIGYQGVLPWRNLADMLFFKSQTRGAVVIMGRKTWESLPKPLAGRVNVVISKTRQKRSCYTAPNLQHALRKFSGGIKPVYVIGGQQLYREAINDARTIYLSEINGNYKCDTFFPEIPGHFRPIGSFPVASIENSPIVSVYENYRANEPNDESAYLNLLEKTLMCGEYKQNRTGVATYSLLNQMLKFKITENTIPIITTKKVFMKGVVNELIWFLNGNRNVKWLQERGVHIWDGNSSPEYMESVGLGHYPEGYIGPMYGAQWTSWGGKPHLNQLADILQTLKTNPNSRRMVMSAWNYEDLPRMALPPCHLMYVFNVHNSKLNCHLTMRSSDMFLGLPFNITSTALLTILLSRASGIPPGEVAISIVDAHIYETHLEAVQEQLRRPPLLTPTFSIDVRPTCFDDMKKMTYENFKFDYFSWPSIKAKMVV